MVVLRLTCTPLNCERGSLQIYLYASDILRTVGGGCDVLGIFPAPCITRRYGYGAMVMGSGVDFRDNAAQGTYRLSCRENRLPTPSPCSAKKHVHQVLRPQHARAGQQLAGGEA